MIAKRFVVMQCERDSVTGAIIRMMPTAVLKTGEEAATEIGRQALQASAAGFSTAAPLFISELDLEVGC